MAQRDQPTDRPLQRPDEAVAVDMRSLERLLPKYQSRPPAIHDRLPAGRYRSGASQIQRLSRCR
jgi:hypothetical protein